MKKFIFTSILTYILIGVYACDCKTITKSEEYYNSELIFLGNITQKYDSYYIIRPIEVFKGENTIVDSTFSAPIGDCLIDPELGETWLIYASYTEDGIIVSSCGHSRSFNKPFSYGDNDIPPPTSHKMPKETQILIDNIYLNKELIKLQFDIQDLRSNKQQEDLELFRIKVNNQLQLIKWLLIVIIALLIILLIAKTLRS